MTGQDPWGCPPPPELMQLALRLVLWFAANHRPHDGLPGLPPDRSRGIGVGKAVVVLQDLRPAPLDSSLRCNLTKGVSCILGLSSWPAVSLPCGSFPPCGCGLGSGFVACCSAPLWTWDCLLGLLFPPPCGCGLGSVFLACWFPPLLDVDWGLSSWPAVSLYVDVDWGMSSWPAVPTPLWIWTGLSSWPAVSPMWMWTGDCLLGLLFLPCGCGLGTGDCLLGLLFPPVIYFWGRVYTTHYSLHIMYHVTCSLYFN